MRIHSVVRRALGQGVKWGWISMNPVANASPPRARKAIAELARPRRRRPTDRGASKTNSSLPTYFRLAAATGVLCGYDGRLGPRPSVPMPLICAGGRSTDPDTVDNGLCLCSFHHNLLDRGVLGITDDHAVSVSAHFVSRGRAVEELVLRLVGQPWSTRNPATRPRRTATSADMRSSVPATGSRARMTLQLSARRAGERHRGTLPGVETVQ